MHYVAGQRYLWSGAYKTLGDIELDAIAIKVIATAATFLLAAGSWALLKYLQPQSSLLACFGI